MSYIKQSFLVDALGDYIVAVFGYSIIDFNLER